MTVILDLVRFRAYQAGDESFTDQSPYDVPTDAPTITSTTVVDDLITVCFNRTLWSGCPCDPTYFTVTVNGTNDVVLSTDIVAGCLYLTLEDPTVSGDDVVVTYTAP